MSHAGRISTVGTSAPSARRPALPALVRFVAASLAVLLLAACAATSASARPFEEHKGRPSVDYSQLPAYPRAYTGRENQAITSRGTGAPASPVEAASDTPRAQSADAGFDWGAAAIGAAAAAGLIALVALGAPGFSARRHLRTAR